MFYLRDLAGKFSGENSTGCSNSHDLTRAVASSAKAAVKSPPCRSTSAVRARTNCFVKCWHSWLGHVHKVATDGCPGCGANDSSQTNRDRDRAGICVQSDLLSNRENLIDRPIVPRCARQVMRRSGKTPR